ncbi:hypothetical protein [Rhodosalinus sp.]|uniref:hypothetical protein n=1 Tax=Rhodosalinus sp. TaxID=2047741 RepID=UPI00397A8438
MNWPARRTRPGLRAGPARLGLAALVAYLAPVPPGMLLLWLGTLVEQGPPAASYIASHGFFLLASLYLSWAGLLVGVPLSILALRTDWAGWAVALGTGAVLAAGVSHLTGLEPDIVLPGALLIAATYWLALRRMIGPALAR